MNKDAFLLCLIVLVLAGGAGYHFHASKHQAPTPGAIASAKGALREPGQAKSGAAQASTSKQASAEEIARQRQVAAAKAAHDQIETALSSMKVSSILLGDPAIVIISKKEHSVGEPLVLPDGKTLQVTGIGEDGVTLAGNGEVFHLAAPAAPELAASRRK